MSHDIGGDELDRRDHGDAQLDADVTADMAHCRREVFIGLAESGGATEIVEREVAGETMCEEKAAVMKARHSGNSDGTRGACARDAYATTAPMTKKTIVGVYTIERPGQRRSYGRPRYRG